MIVTVCFSWIIVCGGGCVAMVGKMPTLRETTNIEGCKPHAPLMRGVRVMGFARRSDEAFGVVLEDHAFEQ